MSLLSLHKHKDKPLADMCAVTVYVHAAHTHTHTLPQACAAAEALVCRTPCFAPLFVPHKNKLACLKQKDDQSRVDSA